MTRSGPTAGRYGITGKNDMNVTEVRLLKTTIPGDGSVMISRMRLLDRLDHLAHLPIVFITATTGIGKTTLASEWARRRGTSVAWYTLDADDNEYRQFIAGIMQALRSVLPAIGPPLQFALQQERERPEDDAATISETFLLAEHPVTLILDDFHVLENPLVWSFIERLRAFAPASFHLILLSQQRPPVDVRALYTRGLVGELTGQDLAFRENESREYLDRLVGNRLSPNEVEEILALTDGWISGIKVAALASAASHPGFAAGPSSPTRAVGALLDILIGSWSPRFRALMQVIAIPDRISPSMLEAIGAPLLGDRPADAVLRDIENEGLFLLPISGEGEWFRVHDLLRQRLIAVQHEVLSPDDITNVHFTLAAWFLDRDDVNEAVRHAVASGDSARAAEIVGIRVHQELAVDHWLEVERWLAQIPESLVANSIELLIARAWVVQSRGRRDALRAILSEARPLLASDAMTDDARERFAAELDLIETFVSAEPAPTQETVVRFARAFVALRGTDRFGELICIQYHLTALSRLDPARAEATIAELLATYGGRGDRFSQFRVLWAKIAQMLIAGAYANVWTMMDQCQSILALATRLESNRQIAFGQLSVGSMLVELEDLEQAEQILRAAATNPYTGIRVRIGAETRLARVLDALGRPDEADRLLNDSLDRLLDADAMEFILTVRTAQMRLAIKRDDRDQAAKLVWALGPIARPNYAAAFEMPMIAQALWFAQSDDLRDTETADRMLALLQEDPASIHWLAPRIQILTIQALRHVRDQHPDDAFPLLEEAFTLAERAGFRRIFADLGPAAEDMIFWFAAEHDPWTFLNQIADNLRTARASDTRRSQPQEANGSNPLGHQEIDLLIEPLTHRELDILERLKLRLTNKEIAEELSISPLTVKSHTRNIYGKLGVNGRRQAIAKAHDLGILQR